PPYTWAVQGLPAGLSLDSSTGIIAGTPSASGSFTILVQVTDASRNTASGTLSLTINTNTNSSLIITTTAPLFNGTVGIAYVQTFGASGGTPPYAWSIASGSTADLTLDPTTGNLQGTPATAGTLTFTVQVADQGGRVASQAFSLVVNAPTLAITAGS